MDRRIYKYQLAVGWPETYNLPTNAIFRHVGVDPSGTPCVWVELDTSAKEKRAVIFEIFGTGHHIPDVCTFAGTFIEAVFVWHVYWRLG